VFNLNVFFVSIPE